MHPNRYPLTRLLLAAWLAAGAALAAPPNVVFVFVDTLRADHLGCYGYRRPTSPWMDRLAREGTLFENAFSQANFSLPSYATVMTSQYPTTHQLFSLSHSLSPGTTTLAQILAAHGYRTGAFVAAGHLLPAFGLNRGFQTYLSTQFLEPLARTIPSALEWLGESAARPARGAGPSTPAPSPFFMFVHGYDCHAPYDTPLGFSELHDPGYHGAVHQLGFLRPELLDTIEALTYDPCRLEMLRANPLLGQPGTPWRRRLLVPASPRTRPRASKGLTRSGGTTDGAQRYETLTGPGGLPFRLPPRRSPLSPADAAHLVAHYDGAITYADTWVGVLLETLRHRGLLEQTIVFVAGDHGEALGERRPDPGEDGRFGHGLGLDGAQLHVPLIVRGPTVAGGRRVVDAVGLIDLAPTVLSLAGIGAFHEFQGHSLAPYLSPGPPPAPDPERAAFSAMPPNYALHTSRWGLVHRGPTHEEGRARVSLHELATDPAETVDLSAQHPEQTSALRGRLIDWLEATVPRARPGETGLEASRKSFFRTLGYW